MELYFRGQNLRLGVRMYFFFNRNFKFSHKQVNLQIVIILGFLSFFWEAFKNLLLCWKSMQPLKSLGSPLHGCVKLQTKPAYLINLHGWKLLRVVFSILPHKSIWTTGVVFGLKPGQEEHCLPATSMSGMWLFSQVILDFEEKPGDLSH